MADHSHIEWTDATWNPITGCSVTSPGCKRCYAMTLAGGRLRNHPSRAGLTQESNAGPVWTGEVRFNADWLAQPLAWKRPRRIFVCAHGDLFHEAVPDAWIDQVFAVMALAPHHTFQVLTKRAERMRSYATRRSADASAVIEQALRLKELPRDWQWPLPNVWLGVSAEDQVRADQRIPDLMATPAFVRFVSLEPLLGPMDVAWAVGHPIQIAAGFLRRGQFSPGLETLRKLDWVIAGGESGRGARPMHPDWVRKIRDDCAAARVAFHFKQWGEWIEVDDGRGPEIFEVDPGEDFAIALLEACEHPAWITPAGEVFYDVESLPIGSRCRLIERLGKKAAGRILDGVTHDGLPR